MTTDQTPHDDETAWQRFRTRWREATPGERVFVLLFATWGGLVFVAGKMQGWKTPSLGTIVLLVVAWWFLFGRGAAIFGAAEGGGPGGANASEGLVLIVQAIMAAQGMAIGARINRTAGGGPDPHRPQRQYPPPTDYGLGSGQGGGGTWRG